MFSKKFLSSNTSTSTTTTRERATSGAEEAPATPTTPTGATPPAVPAGFVVTSKDPVPVHAYPARPALPTTLPTAGDAVITLASDGELNRIKEYRDIHAKDGKVEVSQLPSTLHPSSVSFQSLTEPSAKVLRQIYKQKIDTENTKQWLTSHIGQLIVVVNQAQNVAATGVLRSVNPDSILIISQDQSGKNESGISSIPLLQANVYKFPNLQPSVFTSNLQLTLNSKVEAHLAEISYTCTGLKWEVAYNGMLNSAITSLHLTGWYSFHNNTGSTFPSSKLILINKSFTATLPRRNSNDGFSFSSKSNINSSFSKKSNVKQRREKKVSRDRKSVV